MTKYLDLFRNIHSNQFKHFKFNAQKEKALP